MLDSKPLFIAFEGIDGSGKSTQAGMLAARFASEGRRCISVSEPSGGPAGVLIRQVLSGRISMDNRALAALFAADRLDHILNKTDGLLSMLDKGFDVICDRYYFSSYAYNSVDMPLEWVISINSEAAAILKPSLTFYLDIEPEKALERIQRNRAGTELFEERARLGRVRENYLKIFSDFKEEENIVVLDASKSEAELAELIWGFCIGSKAG